MFGISGAQFSYCAIHSLSLFSEVFSLEPSEFTKSPNNRPKRQKTKIKNYHSNIYLTNQANSPHRQIENMMSETAKQMAHIGNTDKNWPQK
jgi:hypothetical protein